MLTKLKKDKNFNLRYKSFNYFTYILLLIFVIYPPLNISPLLMITKINSLRKRKLNMDWAYSNCYKSKQINY